MLNDKICLLNPGFGDRRAMNRKIGFPVQNDFRTSALGRFLSLYFKYLFLCSVKQRGCFKFVGTNSRKTRAGLVFGGVI